MKISKILISLSIIILLFATDVFAQKSKLGFFNKKKFEEAEYYFQFENYHLALPILYEILKTDSVNSEVNYKAGICHFALNQNKNLSKQYFEKAKDDFIDSYYYLGLIYQQQMLFDRAIAEFQYYKYWYGKKAYTWENIDYCINQCNVAKELIMLPAKVKITKLSTAINTQNDEYVPLIASDETVLFFTSRRAENIGGKKDAIGNWHEDIFYSAKTDSGWGKAVNIGAPVNSSTHDACVSLSPDAQKLFIYRTGKEEEYGNIYYTEKSGSNWGEPVKINAEINTKTGNESSGCISPDEQIFYFSSSRPGGFGGKDLYRVIKFPDGKWSKALNMGPVINTKYDEDAPFIHPDGKTFYFSSKGHKNMGGFDIFKSQLLDTGEWTTPENIGYPVNTVNDDMFFVVTADKMRGYYSCDREGTGNQDIYSVDMPENYSNFRLLKGRIFDSEGSASPVKATITITLIDETSNTLQGVYKTNKETGSYLLIVEPLKKYKVIVEAEDFNSVIEIINIPESPAEQVITRNFHLSKK